MLKRGPCRFHMHRPLDFKEEIMTDTKALTEQRAKLFDDLYSEKIPARVPIDFNLSGEVYIEAAGLPVGKTLWTLDGIEQAMTKLCENIKADIMPKDSGRLPLFTELTGCRGSVMSATGFMQHPEISTMEATEYDEFISDPYAFMVDKVLERLYPEMQGDKSKALLVFYMGITAKNQTMAKYGQIYQKVSEKFGFYSFPAIHNSRSLAPLDFFSDYPRGFTGITKDIKRCPQKVLDATEAVLPMLVKYAKPIQPSYLGSAFMPGHMPTFMRTSEFEKFYYPSFSKLIHATAENGQQFKVFCEDNWTRYVDYLQELPQGTRLMCEYGDPQVFKDKLGKKMVLTGFYPLTLLKTGTKEQCVDKAKELLDILAPGGNYYFGFDKTILTLSSLKLENLYAVLDYVYENGKYDNAGERSTVENKEDTIHHVLKDIPKFKSRLYDDMDIYKQQRKYIIPECEEIMYKQVENAQDNMLKTIVGLV